MLRAAVAAPPVYRLRGGVFPSVFVVGPWTGGAEGNGCRVSSERVKVGGRGELGEPTRWTPAASLPRCRGNGQPGR